MSTQAMSWILVTESLPPVDDKVHVTIRRKKSGELETALARRRVLYLANGTYTFELYCNGYDDGETFESLGYDVIAWMAFPEPYTARYQGDLMGTKLTFKQRCEIREKNLDKLERDINLGTSTLYRLRNRMVGMVEKERVEVQKQIDNTELVVENIRAKLKKRQAEFKKFRIENKS